MVKYERILAAVDLHDDNLAAKKAIEIAKEHQAALTLIHVVEPLPAYAMGYFGTVNIEKELLDEASKKLAELVTHYAYANTKQHIEVGSIKGSILKAAEESKADLIVVGSHGRHGLEVLLGSTASGVLHGATCDVLVVRCEPAEETAG